jgi:hypothetical protein
MMKPLLTKILPRNISSELQRALKMALHDAVTLRLRNPYGELPSEFMDNDVRAEICRQHDEYRIGGEHCRELADELNRILARNFFMAVPTNCSFNDLRSELNRLEFKTVEEYVEISATRGYKMVRGVSLGVSVFQACRCHTAWNLDITFGHDYLEFDRYKDFYRKIVRTPREMCDELARAEQIILETETKFLH